MLCYVVLVNIPMTVTYRPLAGPIRQFLRDRGMSMNALADAIRCDRAYLSRVINGHVTLTWEMGHRIAVGLSVADDAVMEALHEPVEDQVSA